MNDKPERPASRENGRESVIYAGTMLYKCKLSGSRQLPPRSDHAHPPPCSCRRSGGVLGKWVSTCTSCNLTCISTRARRRRQEKRAGKAIATGPPAHGKGWDGREGRNLCSGCGRCVMRRSSNEQLQLLDATAPPHSPRRPAIQAHQRSVPCLVTRSL